MTTQENTIENDFIKKLEELKYTYRPDIRDRTSLEQNFRKKFEALNRVNLTDNEFTRLLEQITSPDVFKTSQLLRERNSFEREDGTPIFDGELLTDLFAPLGLGWKERRSKELELMKVLSPLLKKMAEDKDISGLEVYDE